MTGLTENDLEKSKIIPLEIGWREGIDAFVEQLNNRRITHSVVCYRTVDGDLNFILFGAEHLTYLIGMIERVKMEMNK